MDIILSKIPDEFEKNKTLWIYEDNIPIFEKYNQFQKDVNEKKVDIVIEKLPEKKEEVIINKKQTPINLIINQTFTADVMKNEVRQKLIDFVMEPAFAKAFGARKSGEIVNAILRDSWNQSTALFISFLLDANIIYKDKSYLYNKDKNKLEIMIK
jgi:hypothetical protein